jgi:hypothetical protein
LFFFSQKGTDRSQLKSDAMYNEQHPNDSCTAAAHAAANDIIPLKSHDLSSTLGNGGQENQDPGSKATVSSTAHQKCDAQLTVDRCGTL